MATAWLLDIDTRLAQSALKELKLEGAMLNKKAVKKIVKEELKALRKIGVDAAKSSMRRDPRRAATAVRSVPYKRIIGGKIDIFEGKGKAKVKDYNPRRRKLPKRGGNRAPRSERTKQIDNYYGASRAFILRIHNKGTSERTAGTRGYKFKGAKRGSIQGTDFFSKVVIAGEATAKKIGDRIVDAVTKEFNQQK